MPSRKSRALAASGDAAASPKLGATISDGKPMPAPQLGGMGPEWLTGNRRPIPVHQVKAPTEAPPYAKMMADPLGAPPVGRPDHNANRTNVLRLPDVYTVTSNASGEYICVFAASPNASAQMGMTITAGAVATQGSTTNSTFYTSMASDNVYYRTLVYVVQWMPTFSETTGAGRLCMNLVNSTAIGNAAPLQSLSDFFDDGGVVGPANKPAVTIVRPRADPSFLALTAGSPSVWPYVVVTFTGLPPSLACGQISVTRVYEVVPINGNIDSMASSHTVCDMNACCVAANLVGSGCEGKAGVDDPYKEVKSLGLKMALAATKDIAAWGMGAFMPNTAKLLGS